MRRQKTHGFWLLVIGILALGLVLMYAQPVRAGHHHGFHFGFHHHHFYPHYFPYGFYSYGYYGYPYAYGPYYPEEHRRFPAFRLPAFFHYPGALGKGEGSKQETRAVPANATAAAMQRNAER